MTKEAFLSFYPQFSIVPEVVIDEYVEQSNNRFEDFEDSKDEARLLYIAHKLTMYAQSFLPELEGMPANIGMSALQSSGVSAQALSKSVGGVSVSKSEGAGVSSIAGFGEWKQTVFGLQLITLCKIVTAGGVYVP